MTNRYKGQKFTLIIIQFVQRQHFGGDRGGIDVEQIVEFQRRILSKHLLDTPWFAMVLNLAALSGSALEKTEYKSQFIYWW